MGKAEETGDASNLAKTLPHYHCSRRLLNGESTMEAGEFFRTVLWRATLQVAAIRIAVASILWPLLLTVFGGAKFVEFLPQVLTFLILLSALVIVAIPAIALARSNVPYVGLAALPAWMIVIADPLVKMLHAKRPDLVPVESFKYFNPPVLAIFSDGGSGEPAGSATKEGPQIHFSATLEKSGASPNPSYDVESIDTGSPEERYARASGLWDSKEPSAQSAAVQIWRRMIADGVPYAKPYLVYGNYLIRLDASGNCDEVIQLRRRLVEIEPENKEFKGGLASILFAKGKMLWDEGKESAAFDTYLEGLNHFLAAGQVMNSTAPLAARVAFRACRMFSIQALREASDTSLGVRFFDWCELAGVDPNEDIDISDARASG